MLDNTDIIRTSEVTMLNKYLPGDILWWNNPADKTDENYKLNVLCGARPVVILNSDVTGVQFVPCTTQEKNYKQLRIKSLQKNEDGTPRRQYILKTGMVLYNVDENDFTSFFGTMSNDAYQFVKDKVSTDVVTKFSPIFTHTCDITPVPVGRIIRMLDDGKCYIITNYLRGHWELVPIVESNSKIDKAIYLNDRYTGERYLCQPHKTFIDLARNPTEFEIIGSLPQFIHHTMNWRIHLEFNIHMNRYQSRISELELQIEKLKSKCVLLEKENRDLSIFGNNTNTIKENLKQNEQLKEKYEYTNSNRGLSSLSDNPKLASLLESLNNPSNEVIEETTAEDISEEEIPQFPHYYHPYFGKDSVLKDIITEADIIKGLKETWHQYRDRTGRSYQQWYYMKKKLLESIDFDKAPNSVVVAKVEAFS